MRVSVVYQITVRDASGTTTVDTSLAPGEYKLERIAHPRGLPRVAWYVLEGTRIGAAVGFWDELISCGDVALIKE